MFLSAEREGEVESGYGEGWEEGVRVWREGKLERIQLVMMRQKRTEHWRLEVVGDLSVNMDSRI